MSRTIIYEGELSIERGRVGFDNYVGGFVDGKYRVTLEPVETKPELQPCPFCGNEADADGCDYKYWVRCMHCDATTGTKTTMMQAASYWNRRAA